MSHCKICGKRIKGVVFHCPECNETFCPMCGFSKQHKCDKSNMHESKGLKNGFSIGETLRYSAKLWIILMIIILIAAAGYLFYSNGSEEIGIWNKNHTGLDINEKQLEKRIHELVNVERRKHGVSSLDWDPNIAAIARAHSEDMEKRNYFSHRSPEGYKPTHRYQQANYKCNVPSENLHLGLAAGMVFEDDSGVNPISLEEAAVDAVQGWMNSPRHRENMLFDLHKSEGIGVVINSEYDIFVTQNFCQSSYDVFDSFFDLIKGRALFRAVSKSKQTIDKTEDNIPEIIETQQEIEIPENILEKSKSCLSIENNSASRDACFSSLALFWKDTAFCYQAASQKDKCLFNHAKRINNFSMCDIMTNTRIKDDCLLWKAEGIEDNSQCPEIYSVMIRDLCFKRVALAKGDAYLCEPMGHILKREQCYIEVAVQKKDISICEAETVAPVRSECNQRVKAVLNE